MSRPWCSTARTTRSFRSRTRRRKSARLIKGAKDIYYPGAPHGITATHQDQINAELLAFLRGSPETSRRGDRMMAATSTTR